MKTFTTGGPKEFKAATFFFFLFFFAVQVQLCCFCFWRSVHIHRKK